MQKQEQFIGVLVAGGRVVDLMGYSTLLECRDNVEDSVAAHKNDHPDEPLTQAVVYKLTTGTHNHDGAELVDEYDLSQVP